MLTVVLYNSSECELDRYFGKPSAVYDYIGREWWPNISEGDKIVIVECDEEA